MKKRNLLVMFVAMLLALAMMPIISYAGTNVVEANGGEVTDGQSFVDALGGQATYTESDGIFTITLNGDISLAKDYIDIESGKYILNGSGTITRGEGYTGTLIKVGSGASLKLGGSVVIDGGAVWTKDGEASTPAEGAENIGTQATACLVYNEGSFELTGNAVLQNNDGASALQSWVSCSMSGGIIRNNRASTRAAVSFPHGSPEFRMSGGEISGNYGSGSSGCLIDVGEYSGAALNISGGTIRNNKGNGALLLTRGVLYVSDGTFENNAGGTLFSFVYANSMLSFSGGTFRGNDGVIYSNYGTEIHLSGDVDFVTETDTIKGPVRVEGELTTTHPIHLRPDSYELGHWAVRGEPEIVAANVSKFVLIGSEDDSILINSAGKIDTDPTSLVTDGDSFVNALGGSTYASSTYDSENETYIITLKDNVQRTQMIFIDSGNKTINYNTVTFEFRKGRGLFLYNFRII